MNTMKKGSRGSGVKRLQELGDLLGFDRGPNDGVFGPATDSAVCALQAHLGLKVDGVCGPITWRAIRRAADALDDNSGIIWKINDTPEIYDRRRQHSHPKLYKCGRDPKTIDTIVLHQTGCKMPLRPGGWDRLNAHMGITRDGLVVIANDFIDWIWHAQGLSRYSIGIEIAGNFPGLIDNPRTLWKGGGGPHSLTDGQRQAMGAVLEFIQHEGIRLGFKIDHIMAHRQSKNTRIADPGEQIWKEIGLPMSRALIAGDGGSNFKTGTGRPIPHEWDDKRRRDYWGRFQNVV